MRVEPSLSSDKETVIPFAEKVWIINAKRGEETINGVTGRWVEIRWTDRFRGWAFDGFISEEEIKVEFVDENAGEEFFQKISELAATNPYSEPDSSIFIAPELYALPDELVIYSYIFDSYSYYITPEQFFDPVERFLVKKDNFDRYHIATDGQGDGTIFKIDMGAALLITVESEGQKLLRPGVKLHNQDGFSSINYRLFNKFAYLRTAVLSNVYQLLLPEKIDYKLCKDFNTGKSYESSADLQAALKKFFTGEAKDALYNISKENLHGNGEQLLWHFAKEKKLIYIEYVTHIPETIDLYSFEYQYRSEEELDFLKNYYEGEDGVAKLKSQELRQDEKLVDYFDQNRVPQLSFGTYETLPELVVKEEQEGESRED